MKMSECDFSQGGEEVSEEIQYGYDQEEEVVDDPYFVIDRTFEYERYSYEKPYYPHLSECDLMCTEMCKSIDRFIIEHNLLVAYPSEKLETNKKLIIDWLKEKYEKSNLLYNIDCGGEARILRQLLTHPDCNAERMLTCCTRHPFINQIESSKRPEDSKTKLRITCEEVVLNSKILTNHLKTDVTLLTDAAEYRELVERYNKIPSVRVDICYVWYEDVIRCISVLEKHDYHVMEELVHNRRLLSMQVKETEKVNKIKATASKKNKEVSDTIRKMVGMCLKNMDTLIEGECRCIYEESVPSFLVDRTDHITNRAGGMKASLATINDCFKRACLYANTNLNEEGIDSFNGDLTLEIDEMPLVNFDLTRKAFWGPTIKTLMRKYVEKNMVEDHREQGVDINALVVKMGNREIARTIIPSTTRRYSCFVNNGIHIDTLNLTINNNNNNNNNNDTPKNPSTKRKRETKEPPHMERIKRIRLVKEVEDDPDLVIYRLVITKLDAAPDMNQVRQCLVCTKEKPYKGFYHNPGQYHKERNICHTCMSANTKWRKSQKINS